VSDVDGTVPAWLAGTRLDGVRAFGESWSVVANEEGVRVSATS
jgi:hypothetical protein